MNIRLWTVGTCLGLSALGGLASRAAADDHRKCCKIEVDIDDLDADLYPDGDGWLLRVHYEVDVEDACRGERLTLKLQFSDDDCRIGDADGALITHAIALDQPTECDDDEQTFEGWAEIHLDGGAIRHPRDVDVHARVTREGESCALDTESSSATAHLPVVMVECAPRIVKLRYAAPVVVERRTCVAPIVRVHEVSTPVVVEVRRRPFYVRVGARW